MRLALLLPVLVACGGSQSSEPSGNEPTPAPAGTLAPGLPRVRLERVYPALAFDRMTGLYQAPDGSDRWFVSEQDGRILVFGDEDDVGEAAVFLDITDRVSTGNFEEGLLGLAFAPDFGLSGDFYVNYTAQSPRRTVVSRFSVPRPGGQPDRRSEAVLLEVGQPFANHNGGQMLFGPDGYLYIAFGDGGNAGDPMNNAQDRAKLLGKLLRVDVSRPGPGRSYAIPSDNPFVGQGGGVREEIWAYGLRNPWRFSWDTAGGRLWLGDVGQNSREEIDVIEKGANYGWRVMEGGECLGGPNAGCDREGLMLPVFDYARDGDECSVTGGFVYRGEAIPALQGTYLYGDYCSGRIWGLRYDGTTVTAQGELIDSDIRISSFAQGADGELYALEHADAGGIFKVVP